MQLLNRKGDFDFKKVQEILVAENAYISNLFSILSTPQRNDEIEEDLQEDKDSSQQHNTTTRAKSLNELQERLKAITSKKKLSYKEKLAKKGLKNRMKKKTKQDERNATQKLLRAQKKTKTEQKQDNATESTKFSDTPEFNNEGKMVFSKFDFADLGKKKKKKVEKDPKKLLEYIEKQNEKINQLTESGDLTKAVEIKEKTAWKNALAKADGQKVKDDPILLKKSMQRNEQKQRSSKKKWEKRQENVNKAKEERQKKRTENIEKRKKDKKVHKLKRASKKGRIIPGF